MRDPSLPFLIAAARGALDAGCWVSAVALCAAASGCWIAASWEAVPLVCALLVSISTVSGVSALWYAMRIAIDRRLFSVLTDPAQLQGVVIDESLAELDEALITLGWTNAAKVGRPLDMRVRGTVRLLRGSVVIAVVQWLVVGVAIATRGL
ncbi:hypothetical protein [Paraburkholderia sp. J10-1]|uniref:hypothetical protein n=1 Tax=Paraburkholderia sp. J10-1 TaxID=2805430 RepID=UPI002AB79342|nr:hypothetical protein [Paraburkholderia sp. J10-1]